MPIEHGYKTYKEKPVDDYPFICYAPEADMNINDASGGGGGGNVSFELVNVVPIDDTYGLDKTYNEIKVMIESGKMVYIRTVEADENNYETIKTEMAYAYSSDIVFGPPEVSTYTISAAQVEYVTDNPNGYPAIN